MRRALVLFAPFVCALAPPAAAQRAFAQSVTLPSGMIIPRICDRLIEEGVSVVSIDERPLPDSSASYLAQLAQTIARRVNLAAASEARVAIYATLVMRDGSLARAHPVRQSGHREFDLRTADAVAISEFGGDRVAPPAALPEALRIMVIFGQRENGAQLLATHSRCAALAYPDNPTPAAPKLARGRAGNATLRVMISPAGRVDTATARIVDASDDRFGDAALEALPSMRFVPAEFDGMKVPQQTDLVVPFAAPAALEDSTR